jgi:hypothetical protein
MLAGAFRSTRQPEGDALERGLGLTPSAACREQRGGPTHA